LLEEVEAGIAEIEQRIFTSGGADRRLGDGAPSWLR
jgi:hypothetical protein